MKDAFCIGLGLCSIGIRIHYHFHDEIDALNLIFYRNAIRPGAIFLEVNDIVAEPKCVGIGVDCSLNTPCNI